MITVLFIVGTSFPSGSASSSRALNLVRLLKSVGCKVHVIADHISNTKQNLDVCSFERIENKPNKPVGVLSFEKAKEYCKKNKVDIVLMNAKSDRFNLFANYCNMNNIKLIVENCEWYDYSNYKLGKKDPDFLLNEEMLNNGFRKADGFISISRLLHNYNIGLKKLSIRIPTILDVKNTIARIEPNKGKIKLIYTGRPGKSKELLLPIIQALLSEPKFYNNIEFHIYGPDLLHVLYNINFKILTLFQARKCVHIHGFVKQEEILSLIRNADYQIFLRPDRKSSNAGFPTKLAESMSVGTPVITNDTGDISLYLKDSINGFMLNDNTAEDVAAVCSKIMKISFDERKHQRCACKKTSEDSFDYRIYKDSILKLLKKITNM